MFKALTEYLKIRNYAATKYSPTLLDKSLSLLICVFGLVAFPLILNDTNDFWMILIGLFLSAILFLIGREIKHFYMLPIIILAWVTNVDWTEKQAMIDKVVQDLAGNLSRNG